MAHEHMGIQTRPSTVPPPFPDFSDDDSPTFVERPHDAIEPRYVMLQSAAPLSAEECEDAGRDALEVTVLWGGSVLHVEHLSPLRSFAIGHGGHVAVDFVVPSELAPFARTEIVVVRDGVASLLVPEGASLSVAGVPSAERERRVAAGTTCEVTLGALSFRVALVTAGKRVPRALGADFRGLGASFAATFAAVAAFLGVVAYYTPALGASLDGDLDADRLATLLQYQEALAEREQRERENTGAETANTQGGGTPGQAARGEEGKMGRPNRPETGKRTAIAGSGERVLSRSEALAEAQSFGMIGMLATMNSRMVPHAPWGADVPSGPDAVDAWGALFGEDIGESGGAGGLRLSGAGQGGGGIQEWIGIGTIGTCGTNCGMGQGPGGIGNGVGRIGGGRAAKAPSIRPAGNTVVSGRLPAEVIQRVVRQNYGRFRQCYETGLRANPNLTGRVTARFVINRDGGVATVANGGSDLPDSAVVSCVVSAFYGLTFPAPQDGVVSVSYPIMLVPG